MGGKQTRRLARLLGVGPRDVAEKLALHVELQAEGIARNQLRGRTRMHYVGGGRLADFGSHALFQTLCGDKVVCAVGRNGREEARARKRLAMCRRCHDAAAYIDAASAKLREGS